MFVVAWILFVLVIIHLVMMVLGPLLTLYTERKKSLLAGRVFLSFLSSFGGYCLFGWLLEDVVGAVGILDESSATVLALTSWGAVFLGLGVVVWAIVLSSQHKRQLS